MRAKRVMAKKTSKSVAAAAQEKKPVRRRQRGIRDRIIKILSAGPVTNTQLLEKGRFTPSALYLNLKSLRSAGVIESTRSGRNVTVSLIGGGYSEPVEGEVVNEAPATKKSHSSALVASYVSPELRDALNAISLRLSPVERGEEKLLVLDHLARTMPGAVSAVLRSVMEDLVRLSTLHANTEG